MQYQQLFPLSNYSYTRDFVPKFWDHHPDHANALRIAHAQLSKFNDKNLLNRGMNLIYNNCPSNYEHNFDYEYKSSFYMCPGGHYPDDEISLTLIGIINAIRCNTDEYNDPGNCDEFASNVITYQIINCLRVGILSRNENYSMDNFVFYYHRYCGACEHIKACCFTCSFDPTRCKDCATDVSSDQKFEFLSRGKEYSVDLMQTYVDNEIEKLAKIYDNMITFPYEKYINNI